MYSAVQKSSGLDFAVKSIPKVPRNFPSTPRYLLKLRNEVEVMQQLGASLDAVYLEVRWDSELVASFWGVLLAC